MALHFRPRDWPWVVKLVALLVVTAILPVCLLTLYSEAVMRRTAFREASERNLLRARNTAAQLDRDLADLIADVTIVALAPATLEVLVDSADDTTRAELQALLTSVAATKNLPGLSVSDYAGTVVAATDPAVVGDSGVTAPQFLSAIAGQVRVHDPRFVPQSGDVFMHASAPVRDGLGRIVGVVATRIPMTEIDRLVSADTDFGGHGEFGLLWDERGIALSSPGMPAWRFRPLGTLSRVTRDRLIAEGRFGPDTGRLLEGEGPAHSLVEHARWRLYDERADPIVRVDPGAGLLQVASAAMRDRRWTYAIVVPEVEVLASVHEQSRRNVLAAMTAALIAFGIAVAAARWLSRPLHRIREAARALASGDMSRRVRLARHDEIGQVAEAFDSMADALARKDGELREHAGSLERRVEARTAELRGLLAAIPDLIFRVSRDGRLIDHAAPKADGLLLPPEQFLGRHVTEVLPEEVTRPALVAVSRALAGEAVPPFEYQLQVQGALRQYEARASTSGADSVVFVVRDVTDVRHGEERERFLARAGATLAASLDYDSTVETLAQLPVPFLADFSVVDLLEHGTLHCGAVAGRTPELQAMVRAARFHHPVSLASDHPAAVAILQEAALIEEVTEGMLSANAQSPEHHALLQAIGARSAMVLPLLARGQTLGAMTVASTSQGRRYAQADLALVQELAHRAGIALDNARLYRDLHESSRLKDEFLGIVSHELRTPLNAVLGWAQVLRRTSSDAEQTRRAVEAIERNARAQAQLVDDLLDTSRVISGKIRIESGTVDVRALVDGAVDSFGPMARAAGLQLSATVAADAGELPGDAGRLQQVVGNLVSNALKFTPAGGAVRIAATRAGATIELRVSDTGIGIAPEFLPYVFDRFWQADSTTTRAHGGLGLGLAIARHLVELHGGTIRAESNGLDGGATFTVVLPDGKAARADDPGEGAAEAFGVPGQPRQATGASTTRPSNR